MLRTSLAFLLSLAALPALAHPGDHHGDISALLWHLVSEPDHLAMISIAVVIGASAAISLRRRARNRNKP